MVVSYRGLGKGVGACRVANKRIAKHLGVAGDLCHARLVEAPLVSSLVCDPPCFRR